MKSVCRSHAVNKVFKLSATPEYEASVNQLDLARHAEGSRS